MTRRRRICFWLILASVGVLGGLVGYLRLFSGRVVGNTLHVDGGENIIG